MIPLILLLLSLQTVAGQFDSSSCGTQKGCLFAPSGCKESGNCAVSFSYVVNGKDLVIELAGNTQGYLAVGFSKDGAMGDDSVAACFANQAHISYNDGHHNQPLQANGILQLQDFTSGNGETYCRMSRSIKGQGNSQIFDLDSRTYNILLAVGPVNGQNLGFHSDKWTLPATDLTAYNTQSGFSPSNSPSSTSPSNGEFPEGNRVPSRDGPQGGPSTSMFPSSGPGASMPAQSSTPINSNVSPVSLACSVIVLAGFALRA